jgi:hypothetical protein
LAGLQRCTKDLLPGLHNLILYPVS